MGVEQEGVTTGASLRGYEALLGALVTADRFPALHAAVHSGLFSDGSATDGRRVRVRAAAILDGVEVLIGRQRRSRR